jgi:hypothetical protein
MANRPSKRAVDKRLLLLVARDLHHLIHAPGRSDLVSNRKAANALGLTIPRSLLAGGRADRVKSGYCTRICCICSGRNLHVASASRRKISDYRGPGHSTADLLPIYPSMQSPTILDGARRGRT